MVCNLSAIRSRSYFAVSSFILKTSIKQPTYFILQPGKINGNQQQYIATFIGVHSKFNGTYKFNVVITTHTYRNTANFYVVIFRKRVQLRKI